MHLLGLIRFWEGHHADAIDYIEKAIAHAEPNEEYLHNLGQIYNLTAKFDQASAYFRKALDLDADYVDAHVNLGIALQGMGKPSDAIARYEKALAVKPGNPEAYFNLGTAHQEIGQLDAAVANFEKSLAIKPDYLEARVNLGNVFRDQGRLNEAEAALRQALTVGPDSAITHSNLGNVLRDLGRLDDAVACYREAVAIQPVYPEALANMGAVLMELGRLDDAIASCRKAVSMKPDLFQAHYNLGLTQMGVRRLEDAAASFRDALALDPDSAVAHGDLGHVLKDLGRLDEAKGSYQRALKIAPDMGNVRHFLAAVVGETTEIPPEGYVRRSFDAYAKRFDDHLTNTLGYKIPFLMHQAIGQLDGGTAKFDLALDLGCGTGLVGQKFRETVGRFHGNDISPEMMKIAEKKKIYDELFLDDALEFLKRPETRRAGYDAVFAADFFIYVGNLAPFFSAVSEVLTAGGLFVFSVERLDQGTSKLLLSGRYAQSETYIRDPAAGTHFSVELRDDVIVRTERGEPIAGNVYILKKRP